MQRQSELIEHEVVVNDDLVLKLKIPKRLSAEELDKLLWSVHNTVAAY